MADWPVLSMPFARTPTKEGGMSAFSGGRELAYLAFLRPDVCSAEGQYPFVTKLASEPGGQILLLDSAPATPRFTTRWIGH